MDLSEEGFILRLAEHTKDLDIGLVVSNAGTANPGEFLKLDRHLLEETLRLNTMSRLGMAHYFGRKLAVRRRGGLILVGAMGAENGIPCIAKDGGGKVCQTARQHVPRSNCTRRGMITDERPVEPLEPCERESAFSADESTDL